MKSQISLEEFLREQITGFIPSHAYESFEEPGGIGWIGPVEKCPVFVKTFVAKNGVMFEFRQSGEKLRYVKLDEAGNIIYNKETGNAEIQTHEEMVANNLPLTDRTIVAFDRETAIGYVADEWGVPGVFIERAYQRQGIGLELLWTYHCHRPIRYLGQATEAGRNLAAAFYYRLKESHEQKELQQVG